MENNTYLSLLGLSAAEMLVHTPDSLDDALAVLDNIMSEQIKKDKKNEKRINRIAITSVMQVLIEIFTFDDEIFEMVESINKVNVKHAKVKVLKILNEAIDRLLQEVEDE